MEYITTRRFPLPECAEKMAEWVFFNMWQRKLPPYKELSLGDVVYFRQSPTKRLVWKTRVVKIDRFPYESKAAVRNRLTERFGVSEEDDEYFMKASEQGYCLAFKVKALESPGIPRPSFRRIPQHGWLRLEPGTTLGS